MSVWSATRKPFLSGVQRSFTGVACPQLNENTHALD